MTSLHCPAIHNGLALDFKTNTTDVFAGHCCIRPGFFAVDSSKNIWLDEKFSSLRKINQQNVWDKNCKNCELFEINHGQSLRLGLLEKYGVETTLSGPRKIDLLFDVNCNLACRTCTPHSSSLWQRHLKDNNLPVTVSTLSRFNDVVAALKNLDLSNLQEIAFSGGETLLGNNYWNITKLISELTDASKITLSFQSNGTQGIDVRYHSIIEKFHLVKINFSIDGLGPHFEYLRWPANWTQVITNINEIKQSVPSNVMFNIEETVSIFNLFYLEQNKQFHNKNFSCNREGDVIHYSNHLAGGIFSINHLTQEYAAAMQSREYSNLVPKNFKENPQQITKMIQEIKLFDGIRGQNFETTFPEVAEFYSKYL